MKKTVISSVIVVLVVVLCTCAGLIMAKDSNGKASNIPEAASFINDTEILLVNEANALPEGYAPEELVNLYEQKRHFLLASSDIYLEREAFEAANRMFKQAEDESMNGFIITSGYRSSEKQAELYETSEEGTAQLPGHSEHETGLAFDVTARRDDDGGFETTEQFAWLIEHCWDYGFILRYPEGKEHITGITYEPWHYRYVGLETAQAIRESGLTLEEYLYSISAGEGDE